MAIGRLQERQRETVNRKGGDQRPKVAPMRSETELNETRW